MDSRALPHAGLPASPSAARPPGLSPSGRTRPGGTLKRGDRLGVVFLVSIVWLVFDLGRPYTPPGLPLVLTAALFIDWLAKREKQLGPSWIWWLVLLGVIASGVLFAANTFSAYFYTRLMGILFLGICLPLQGLLT